MNKKIYLLFTSLIISTFLIIGCSKKQESTNFQNAYFKISSSSEKNNSLNKNNLESIIGTKVSEYKKAKNKEDYNAYIFKIDDEELKVCLNADNKLGFIEYKKLGEITLANNLEENSAVGEYATGFTSNMKLDSLEEQQKIFDEINK
ncbi:hypothetical protein K0040_12470 [Terrisporobacter petrolearius]|uniref:hypothetical protein n=1 Tax=Terrisporobacter petrolearius TaxID=1460447 RepID=UPI001D168F26|nr:hypothetical protein [Terrisporobacter petrolearius]MCC3865087.1 hypothetical protein [Terrisporobacter petrolearius]